MHAENSELTLDWGFTELLDKGFVQLYSTGEIVSINKKAEGFLGLKDQPATSISSILYPSFKFLKGDPSDLPQKGDYQLCRDDVSLSLKIRELNQEMKVAIIEDISEEVNEEKLRSRFLSLVSHKLRTPVVALSYSMNLCLYKEKLGFSDKEEKDFMEQAYLKSFELSELIEKLINYTMADRSSLPQTGEYIVFNESLADALKSYNSKYSSLRENYTVNYDQNCMIKLFMSREHFFIIVQDIVDNALKFTDKEDCLVNISVTEKQGKLRIDFDDDGPGIPAEQSEKVFEPFCQLEEFHTGMVEGIGLGLSLVKRICALYAGEIEIAASPISGTRVRIWLDVLNRE